MYTKLLVAIIALLGVVRPSLAGVLIGELPRDGSADIRDIRWKFTGDDVTFVVVAVGPDGKTREIQYGPYPRSLVRQSIRYAADNRPLTVTVINTKPLPDQKVLLNPALIDTPEGRHAIRLDLLVRRYAKPQWDEAVERAYRHHALYQLAWAARYQAALEIDKLCAPFLKQPASDEDRARNDLREKLLEERLKHAREVLADSVVRKRAEAALADLPAATGERSLLRVKSEYYDQELVALLAKAAVPDGIDGLVKEIASAHEGLSKGFREAKGELDQYKEEGRSFKDEENALVESAKVLKAEIEAFKLFPTEDARLELLAKAKKHDERVLAFKKREEKLREMGKNLDKRVQELFSQTKSVQRDGLTKAPEITVPSGVRELRFAGTLDDYAPATKASPLPFRFMVQVAFTTAPAFLKDRKPEDYSDTDPYEFTDLEPTINAKVLAGLRQDMDAAETAREMATFVKLQRLFRAGISGKLGEKFPTSRLNEFAAALGKDDGSRVVRTLRWSPDPVAVEKYCEAAVDRMLSAVEDEDSDEARKAAAVLKKCKGLIAERATLRKKTGEALDGLDSFVPKFVPASFLSTPALTTGTSLIGGAGAAAWDRYAKGLDDWMARWEQVVGELGDTKDAKPAVAKAGAVLADLTYMLQIRHKMRVVDDERLVREEANWHRR